MIKTAIQAGICGSTTGDHTRFGFCSHGVHSRDNAANIAGIAELKEGAFRLSPLTIPKDIGTSI